MVKAVIPLDNGNYYIRWASCRCVELDAVSLIKVAEEILNAL